MKKLLILLLALVSVIGLSACQKEELKIGFAASTFTNPFFNDIKDGILETLEGSGYELVALGADNDAAVQAGQIEDLIAQGVKLILLNPVDSTTVGTKIDEANAAGIPVITVDRSAESGEVIAHVASDNVAGGEMAAEYLQSVCPDGLPVLQLTGQAGASAAIDRQAGFESVWGVDNIDQTSTANVESYIEGVIKRDCLMVFFVCNNRNCIAFFAQSWQGESVVNSVPFDTL